MTSFRRISTRRARLSVLLAVLALALPAPVAVAQEAAPTAPLAAPSAATAPAPESPAADAPANQDVAPQDVAPQDLDTQDPAPQDLATENLPTDTPASEYPGVRAGLPHDLSPWGMFLAADRIVQAVMIGLAFASVVTWTVWLAKSLELVVVTGGLRRRLRALLASGSLEAARAGIGEGRGAAGAMVRAADLELGRSGALPAEGIKERVAISLARIEAAAGRRIGRGTGLLATIGATAPFVGLFGTVWGIMNAFVGISQAQTTNLAVVAPGIAEALLATAMGLVAAIPAVVIYNHFARQVSAYRALLGDASAEMLRLLSRDLDRRDAGEAERRRAAARRLHAVAE